MAGILRNFQSALKNVFVKIKKTCIYNVLIQLQFSTSKTKLDTWYNKLGKRVVSRDANQLKT